MTDYYDSLCAILTLCVRLSSGCYVSVVLRVVTYVLLAGVVVGNEVEMRNCLSDEFLDSKPCCVTDTQADVLSCLNITLSVICSFDCFMYCARAHLFDAPPVPHPSIICVCVCIHFFYAAFMLSKIHYRPTVQKFKVGEMFLHF